MERPQWQYSVDPSTGAVSSAALTTENYYDPNGNLIATSAPGGLWTKLTYNGAGEEVMDYQTDGGSGTSYADACRSRFQTGPFSRFEVSR